MIKEFLLYESSAPAIGALDSFLGGLCLVKGVPLFLQLAILVFYTFSFALILLSDSSKSGENNHGVLNLSRWMSLCAFTLNCLLVFTPWDESFINLRHSLNLSQHNFFSFNLSNASEGTADFLVFFLLGLLGKLGIPLFELLLFQSWLGGLLCIWAIKQMALEIKIPKAEKWSVFLATLFPTLILNSSHGFATSIFSAAILWTLYFIFIRQKLIPGFALLALIPVIRWEGFWFLALTCAFLLRDLKFSKKNLWGFLLGFGLLFVPMAILIVYRLNHFNSWIPVPVVYKSSIGNLFYLILGFRNFILDFISTFAFAFAVPVIMSVVSKIDVIRKNRALAYPLLILVLCSLPYYFSGGDWFPPAWGRYLLPLTLYLAITTWKVLTSLDKQQSKKYLAAFIFSGLICALAPTSSLIRIYELMFSHGSALLSLNLKKRTENPLYRPHYLSQLGYHLKRTTNSQDRIASSELATLMYFSERDAVDFLGLTDAKLANLPLRKTPAFVRKNPKSAELPLLIFKRVAPERLSELRPEYLYLFDFMIEILMDQKSTADWTDRDYLKAIHRWESKFRDLVTPLYGGVDNILSLGYTPIVVCYDHDFCALYFVIKEKLPSHKKALTALGLQGRLISE